MLKYKLLKINIMRLKQFSGPAIKNYSKPTFVICSLISMKFLCSSVGGFGPGSMNENYYDPTSDVL